ncbi:uncharacterized protein DEA37_0004329 [Paragonimus westermani]|uniref:Ig-like domain-containing protein n=1 Tax=Paragonimus westermani TaxID=34504 RepID=A0A5J4N6K4_9TREM|nr:uncharacterized protein DEA37_0014240 [Paragonimus westermani]KAA3671156.1 uncharacterized protein DEA37_0004329 [Paragonimus westermani]
MVRPMFLQRLPETADIGETNPVVFCATFTGQPTPTVQLFRNGLPLTQNDRMFYTVQTPDTITLSMTKPLAEDSGVYTVCIENPMGKDSCSLSLNVIPTPSVLEQPKSPLFANVAPPRFIRGPLPWSTTETGDVITCPGQLVVKENNPVSLEVEVIGQPAPAVAWYRDLQPIPSDGLHKIFSRQEGTSTLLLDKPSVDIDSGLYSCVATNNVGQATLQFTVHIKPRPPVPKPPKFIEKPPSQLTIPLNKPLTLHAVLEATPNLNLSWHRGGKLISSTPDGRITVDIQPQETTVWITSVQPEDLTNWECVAANTAGTASARLTISAEHYQETVELLPTVIQPEKKAPAARAPRFTQFLQPVTAPEFSEVSFIVQFDAEPAPQVTWYREEVNLELKPDYQIATTQHTSQLTIPRVLLGDTGNFSVVLINPAGQACSKARLVVERAPPKPAFVGQPPKFQSPFMHSTTVKVGEPVTFECKVHGEPTPQVHWERNGVRLSSTETTHLKMFDQPPFHTLVLCAATPEDTAEYRCVAVNPLGQDTCTAQICVEVPEVTWLARGEVIKPSSYFQPQILPNGEARLVISSAYLEDAGDYTVRAVNPAGEATATARLIVQAPLPKTVAPRFTTPLPSTPIQIEEGSPVRLNVEVDGEPLPEVTWYRNGQPFKGSPDWKCVVSGYPQPTVRWFHNGIEFQPQLLAGLQPTKTAKQELSVDQATHTYTLYIHDLNAFDVGEILVRAENELGVTVCQSVLELEVLDGQIVEPRFVRHPPERVHVSPGQAAQLECEVEAIPPVTFRWYLDGAQVDHQQLQQTQKTYQCRVVEETNRTTLIIPRLEPSRLPTQVKVEAAAPTGTKIVSTTVIEMMASTDVTDVTFGEAMQTIPREQSPPPSPLRFTRKLQPQLSLDRKLDSISFDVEVEQPLPDQLSTVPIPVFSWYRNGIDILLEKPERDTERRYDVVKDHPWHSRLTINRPDRVDSGEITCMVSRVSVSGEEVIYTTCVLDLAYPPTETPTKPESVTTELKMTPQFSQSLPAKISPIEGSTVVLDVTARGIPVPELEWTVSSMETVARCEIMPTERIDEATVASRLVLREFQRADRDAVIEVKASSELGHVTTSCQLEAPPETSRPEKLQFSKLLVPELEVPESGPVVLECAIQPTTTPAVFHWCVQGVEIMPQIPQFNIQSTPFTSTLRIDHVTSDLVGPVSVIVEHPQGQITSVSNLKLASVKELPTLETETVEPLAKEEAAVPADQLRFTRPLTAEVLRETESMQLLILDCQVRSELQPVKIQWLRQGQELYPSEHVEMVYEEQTGLSRLIVHALTPTDSGEYTCVATTTAVEPKTGMVTQRRVESSASVIVGKQISEESVVTVEPVKVEEVAVEEVKPADLQFLTPVTPQLRTISEKELQLE